MITSILALQQLVFISEEYVPSWGMIFFCGEKRFEKQKWCGVMRNLRDSWNDIFWVVFSRKYFGNV